MITQRCAKKVPELKNYTCIEDIVYRSFIREMVKYITQHKYYFINKFFKPYNVIRYSVV